MKLVVSFYGMCLCVIDGRKGERAASASVLLLNGATPPPKDTLRVLSRPQLPYHHPLLFVPAARVDLKRSAPPVPTPDALVDTERLMSGRHHGWSLAGLDLTLGKGKGISLYRTLRVDDGVPLPNPAGPTDTKAYLDWRRLPDLTRIAPGCRLRPEFEKIGRHVLGIVRFTGGELRGAAPKNVAGNAQAWHFSQTFQQVVTDRFEFHCELPGSELVATGAAGGRPQVIRLTGAAGKVVRVAVVHEATPSDSRIHQLALGPAAASEEALPHYMAFYDAIRGGSVSALAPPRRTGGGGGMARPIIDVPDCPPAVFPRP